MLFRMGPDRRQVLLHLEAGGDFREPACRHSLGLSTDEPLPGSTGVPPTSSGRLPGGRRLFIFHPRPWSQAAAQKILSEVKPW